MIKIVENRSEIGAGTRGSSLGVDAIKIAALNANSSYFHDHECIRIKDENHQLFDEVITPYARKISAVYTVCKRVCDSVSDIISSAGFPIVLSGDHSSAAGTIAGVKKANPDKRLGVIWIDAHADLHSPYSTPSGNMHGMPLAISIADDNKEEQINEVSENTVKAWDNLKDLGGIKPKIHPENLVFIGVRSAEDPEEHVISKYKIKDILIKHVKEEGIQAVASQALSHLAECDMIYVSFDVDSMDSKISKGTGTPMPDGLTETQAVELVSILMKNEKVCCLEICEVNPTLDDKGNLMAENAFKVLEKATEIIEGTHVKNKHGAVAD